MSDLRWMSTADLEALQAGDLSKVSTQGLQRLQAGQEKPEQTTWMERQKKGLATAPINAYLGIKQKFGGLDSIEQSILAQNKEAERAAPVASLFSNLGVAVPAMMVPGANTLAGAGVVGALQGLTQPVEGEQTLGNIARGTVANTAMGGALGTTGQYGANKVAGFVANRFAGQTADAAAAQSRNSLRDSALQEGRAAGYVVPNSDVAPSFLGNRLESLGGKAAIKQDAAASNQQVTNELTRKALGLPDDLPISQGTLDGLRKTAGKAYQEVAALSPQAQADLEALKVARSEATGWFTAYNRSARPDDLAKARAAQAASDQLETALEGHATAAGKADLIPALTDARKQIAKTYTVQRALNKATGDVSAPVLGRILDKGKPLSDGLDTVARFNQAFPKFTGVGATTPAAGVSKSEMLVGATLGGLGMAGTGSPEGALAAALPLLSHPARAAALSRFMQMPPKYRAGLLTRGAAAIPNDMYGLLGRSSGAYFTPGLAGLLAAE